ncbi:hypothetical protein DFQ01_11765 [Paenibacillus cellulosilyticus]|uniref:Uncharacterized protein n=1 Tax=Paenibacillus cellulosilyticus TaxID=375489 RepID=A0A2V2YQ29_9BACL|nr:hypothetical protein DFQ01_11765 [Paenibacillus cellulosilyticus]
MFATRLCRSIVLQSNYRYGERTNVSLAEGHTAPSTQLNQASLSVQRSPFRGPGVGKPRGPSWVELLII